METPVAERAPVFGHDLLTLLRKMGGRARAEDLRNAAAGAFGEDALYANCHGGRFTFDEALAFLASKGKLEHRDDEVFLGAVPACSGH